MGGVRIRQKVHHHQQIHSRTTSRNLNLVIFLRGPPRSDRDSTSRPGTQLGLDILIVRIIVPINIDNNRGRHG